MLKRLLPFNYNGIKKLLPILAMVMALTLSSCGGVKGVKGSATADANMATKSIIASHKAASPNFKTLAARLQVVYETEDKMQSITTSVRMEKDKTIWIKASLLGITLAKVLITPERVSYYETIGNTYFDGDFAFLSDILGTEIDFQKAQAILLGQSIFSLSGASYTSEIIQNKYRLTPKQQAQNFLHTLLLKPANFKIDTEIISQPSKDRNLIIHYADYKAYGTDFYPSEIKIEASETESKTKIEMNYKKIDLNVSLSFPFTIPKGYEEIDL